MAALTLGAQKLIETLAQTALNAQKLKEALAASSGAEQLRKQFEGIGLSAAQAKQKVAELASLAASGIFNLESLGAASKNLQVVGGAALNTRDNLKKVADMAAAAGTPIDSMATAYARLITSMKGGGGSEAAQQLAEMGAISSETAKKIQDITAAGGSFSEKMNAVAGDLSRSKGAADDFGTTLAGLQTKLAALNSNNALKIGDMFAEGEKSALRAEIAFKKLRNAIDESTSAPFAAISEAFNNIKESVAKFLTSGGNVQAIVAAMNAVFAAATGIFVTASVALLGFVRTLVVMGASAFTAAGGMTALNATMRSWIGLGAGALGGISAVVTGLVLFGARALQTSKELDVLVQKNKELAEAGSKGSSKLEALIPKVKAGTVEDKQAAMEQANTGVDEAQARVENAKKALKQENEQDTGWHRAYTMDWFGVVANQRKISAEGEVGLSENDLLRRKNARSSLSAISSESLGMDRENLQKKFQRNDLIENIRNSAFENLQASADPESAARMSASELKRATEKDDRNQVVSKQSYAERQKINDASSKIATSDTSKQKEQAFSDLQGLKTQTESGGIQKDIDYRKALATETSSVQSEKEAAKKQLIESTRVRDAIPAKDYSGGEVRSNPQYDEANKAVEEAQKKAADIAEREKNVKARSAGIDLSGKGIQELEIARDAALKKEDPNISTQQKEEARLKNQANQEALAARNKLIQRQSEKAGLENKLSSLSDSGENAEFKINEQSKLDKKNNLVALAAAQNLQQKNDEYDKSRGTPQEEAKRKELEQARTQAASAGVDGRTVAQIQSELTIERQITEQKLQAARVAEAGAKAEYDAAMRRLNVEHQISQLKADQAKSNNDGTAYKGKTEAGITQDAAKKEVRHKKKRCKHPRPKTLLKRNTKTPQQKKTKRP